MRFCCTNNRVYVISHKTVRNGEVSANQNCSLMHGDTKQLSMKTLARLDVAAKIIMYCSVVCWYWSAVVSGWDAPVIRSTFACPGGYWIPEWYYFYGGTRWRSWLRHCVTSRKVAGSIPGGVIGIFQWHNPSGRNMALGSTQPLTEMNTRNISRGKGGRRVGLIILPFSCADCHEIWDPQFPGTLRACPGL